MHYDLPDYFRRMSAAETEQQRRLWAKLFVRHWLDLHKISVEPADRHGMCGQLFWCRDPYGALQ